MKYMNRGVLYFIYLSILIWYIYSRIKGQDIFPSVVSMPVILTLLWMGLFGGFILYNRSNSLISWVVLFGFKTVGIVYILRSRLFSDEDNYITDIYCGIDGDTIYTTFSYLGIPVKFSQEVEPVAQSYLSVLKESTPESSQGDVSVNQAKSSLEFISSSPSIYNNCSLCAVSNIHSASIEVSVNTSYGDHISWTLSVCPSCLRILVQEQLKTLKEEYDIDSKLVGDVI